MSQYEKEFGKSALNLFAEYLITNGIINNLKDYFNCSINKLRLQNL